MKRKLSALLLTVVLLATTISVGFAESEQTYQNYGDVQLTLLNCWNGSGAGTSQVDWYNNRAAQVIREKIGVTVTIEGIMMNEAEKLNLIFASGDMPDIIDCAYWASPSTENTIIKKAATEGLLLPIDDYFTMFPDLTRAFDIGVISSSFKETDVEAKEFNGLHYVIPCETPGSAENVTRWSYGLCVRGDIPELIGIDATSVHTPEDLYNFLKAIKEAGIKDIDGNDVIPLSTSHNGWALDMAYVYYKYPAGARLTDYMLDKNGAVTRWDLTDSYVQGALYVRKLIAEGLLDKECFTQSDAQVVAKMASGSIAVDAAMYEACQQYEKSGGILLSNPEMKMKPLGPMYMGNGIGYTQMELNGKNGSHIWCFPTTNKNLEATLAWINYINSEEGRTLLNYGIEGETFEYDENGQPRLMQYLLDMQADPTQADAFAALLREYGMQQYTMCYGNLAMEWFGQSNAFAAQTDPDLKAFYDDGFRDLELVDGKLITSILSDFPRYEDYKLLLANADSDALLRAYFADTDEEATAIISEYQNYLLTGENGVLVELLDYLTEQLATRSDWLF